MNNRLALSWLLVFASAVILLSTAGCRNRTFVLVTVDADPALAGSIQQIRFVSRLSRGEEQLITDERLVTPPSSFPGTFIVLADDRGEDGDAVEVLVEGLGGGDAIMARGRTSAPIIANDESTAQVRLTTPCTTVNDCFAGGTFCDNPVACDCEGEDCEEGFCADVPIDDGNPCTEGSCNEDGLTVLQENVDDGTACENDAGAFTCAAGICGCGDGITNAAVEDCDDGEANGDEPNRCRALPACVRPRCGDGIVDDEFGEECDEGDGAADDRTMDDIVNANLPDRCRVDCKLPTCGDDILDSGEQCDEGQAGNSDTTPLACRTSCMLPSCGDGIVDTGFAFGQFLEEECDDGAGNSNTEPNACRQLIVLENGAGATVECKLAFCGDAVTDAGERCDDNNSVNGDGCNPTCSLFGRVSTLAGQSGGPGSADGTGTDARIADAFAIEVVGTTAFFTSRDDGSNAVRAVDLTTGEVTTIAGDPNEAGSADGTGTEARFSVPRGLASDGTTLFVIDNGDRIRAIDIASGEVSTVVGPGASGPLAAEVLLTPRLLALEPAGRLLMMQSDGDTMSCLLKRYDLNNNTAETIGGGEFCIAFDGEQGAGFGSLFSLDTGGMTMADDGFLYVTDDSAVRRVQLTPPFAVVTIAGATGDPGNTDGPFGSARFTEVNNIAARGNELFVADLSNNAIRRLDLGTSEVSTLALSAALTQPTALAHAAGSLLVGEKDRATIRTIDLGAAPAPVSEFVGRPSSLGATDGVGTAARFFAPKGLAVFNGTTFVADSSNGNIRTVSLDTATVDTLVDAGDITDVFDVAATDNNLVCLLQQGGDVVLRDVNRSTGAFGTLNVEVERARGVAVAGAFAYLANPTNQVIERVELATGNLVDFAGDRNTRGFADGPVNVALFSAPIGITSCAGALFIAESEGTVLAHVIRKIDLTVEPPVVSTVAGAPGRKGSQDGIGGAATFASPVALACDGESLYVAEQDGQLIRQIELASNRVTTLVGSPGQGSAVNGVGNAARVNSPRGIAFDPASGDLVISDTAENVVRRIE